MFTRLIFKDIDELDSDKDCEDIQSTWCGFSSEDEEHKYFDDKNDRG